MEELLVKKLIEKSYKVSTAESCTGGLVAATIINVSGSSAVIDEAHITYSNESKMKYLNVEKEVLDNYGAVSEECAIQMAKGVAFLANSNIGLATTGIAGPLGGTEYKPVGTVYSSIYLNGKSYVYHNVHQGSRQEVRDAAVKQILSALMEVLNDN